MTALLDWFRDPQNAAAAQALSAIGQIGLGAVLAIFTVFTYRLSTATAKTSQEQHLDSTVPVVMLSEVKFGDPWDDAENMYCVRIKIENGGAGPALDLTVDWKPAKNPITRAPCNVKIGRISQPTALAVGGKRDLEIIGPKASYRLIESRDAGPLNHDPETDQTYMGLGNLVVDYCDLYGRVFHSTADVELVLSDNVNLGDFGDTGPYLAPVPLLSDPATQRSWVVVAARAANFHHMASYRWEQSPRWNHSP